MIELPVAQESGKKVLRRRAGMRRFVEAVEEVIRRNGMEPFEVRLGPDTPAMVLDRWAVGWIRSAALSPKDLPGLRELLLQCLAFLLKAATDAARLENEEPRSRDGFFAVQAELMLDSAVGMALSREIQTAVNDLVRLGALGDATKLSRLRQQVRLAVNDLKRCINASNRGRDETLVEHLTDEAEVAQSPSVSVVGAETKRARAVPQSAAPRKRVRATTRTRLRSRILPRLVGVACVAWLASRAYPKLFVHALRPVSRYDFSASAPIVHIEAPPPSAYVVVDLAGWNSYDEKQQRRLVDMIGGVLDAKGYWGLWVRTTRGDTVARWFVNHGSTLIQRPPDPAVEDAPPQEHFERFVP